MCNSTIFLLAYFYNQNPCILCPCQTRNSINIVRPGRRANLLFLLGQWGKTSQLLSATKFIIVFNSLALRKKNTFQHLLLFYFWVTDPFSCPRTKKSRKVHAFKVLQFLIVIILVHVIRSIWIKSKKSLYSLYWDSRLIRLRKL